MVRRCRKATYLMQFNTVYPFEVILNIFSNLIKNNILFYVRSSSAKEMNSYIEI